MLFVFDRANARFHLNVEGIIVNADMRHRAAAIRREARMAEQEIARPSVGPREYGSIRRKTPAATSKAPSGLRLEIPPLFAVQCRIPHRSAEGYPGPIEVFCR